MVQFMGLQRLRHDSVTEQQWKSLCPSEMPSIYISIWPRESSARGLKNHTVLEPPLYFMAEEMAAQRG